MLSIFNLVLYVSLSQYLSGWDKIAIIEISSKIEREYAGYTDKYPTAELYAQAKLLKIKREIMFYLSDIAKKDAATINLIQQDEKDQEFLNNIYAGKIRSHSWRQ